ncbi:hypothetical protein GGR52DRAFT_359361 [Hypoxylon sp. FL1284]|nr:hypothetical protein GGR52DRAFT_359361 [Hypoxylon sp. FL1284]
MFNMKFSQSSCLIAVAISQLVAGDSEPHGEGYEGTVMGPVAFLWPDDRPWSASTDNSGPCGSSSGVGNRTSFPLSQGSVALSIADDAWNVNVSIAYNNGQSRHSAVNIILDANRLPAPTVQSQFTQQVVSEITELEAGHQCYKVAAIPDTVTAGANATIQLEYWSNVDNELNGRNQTFYACADITFVEPKDLKENPPCFNVTASDFNSSDSSSPASMTLGQVSGDGLSAGAKAGIAVGVVAASLAVVGVIAFVVLRRRKARPADGEAPAAASKVHPEVASVSNLRH